MTIEWHEGIETVVRDDLRFKAKLAIGEDAYKLLKTKNRVSSAWDTYGAVGTGVTVAQSALVAETFFASSTLLGKLTFGALGASAAATPIGWVVAAGALAGGAWVGMKRLNSVDEEKVTVIPKFINTPIDLLGLGIFNLLASLAIKIAAIDGVIDDRERDHIYRYLVEEWGYDDRFTQIGLHYIEENISNYSIKGLSEQISEYTRKNPDCNREKICKDIIQFLKEIIEVDGVIDEREEMALERAEKILMKGSILEKALLRLN